LTDFLNRIQEISLVNIDKLNGNPSLLRTKSNHYDLQETKVIESGLKTNYMINMLGSNFDTEAKAPKWEKFISEIVSNNLEYAGFLQRLIGYILSGYTVEQCLFILIGTGANGKTVFTETIKNLLGTYANMADKKLLAKNGKGADKEISNLIGKRLVILNELDSDTKIRIDTFKKITGSDSLCFEFNKQHVEFQNTAKIFILSNTFPDIQDYTYATWRRIKILPFNNQFDGENRDLFLIEELKNELPGILNWAIKGYKLWREEGYLRDPEIVIKAKQDVLYKLDPVALFIDEKCNLNESAKCSSAELYSAYKEWCKDDIQPFASNKFGTILSTKGFKQIRLTDGNRGYSGLSLKD
jgi:putative DNA primase/helicase